MVVSAADVCRFDAAEKGTKQKKTFLCGGTKRRRVLFTRRDHTDIPDVHAHQVTHTHTHTHTHTAACAAHPLSTEGGEGGSPSYCVFPPSTINPLPLYPRSPPLTHTHTHTHTL